jgi:hypothetical protein
MLPFLQFWLWVSIFATLAGWILSAAGQLNRTGYAVAFAIFAVFLVLRWRTLGFSRAQFSLDTRKAFRRFRRPLPFCFFALAFLIFISGAMHPPANYTGLTYRAGRVLQWLSREHWFWIHTLDYRMNDRACGIEWLTAPILLFTHSTRALFLLNFLPFLLLPGLIFSVLIRLNVRGRVAWQWMWLLPAGYTFLLQAGGNANDTFPTVYALAAVYFALRAKNSWPIYQAVPASEAVGNLWLSLLAASLLTGAKASNLPLLLPWAIAVLPSLAALRTKITGTVLIMVVAAAVSFLPSAILNIHYIGDWSGLSIEREGMSMKNPLVGIWGNAFLLLLDNFTPPLFPMATWWNDHALNLLPHFFSGPMVRNFEPGFLWLGELPTEDWSGIGFGVSMLLAVAVIAGFLVRNRYPASPRKPSFIMWVVISPWVALLAYCMKSGMVTPDRLIAPYYPLLLPLLLMGRGQSEIVRRLWWRLLAGFSMFLAFIVLVLLPDRPLWPAQTVLTSLAAHYPANHLIARARDVYAVYAKRSDPLADVRDLLPPEAKVVGFIGAEDDCDISFWLPLGSRRVEHFLLTDPAELYRQEKVQYVLVGGQNLELREVTLQDWMHQTGAELLTSTNGTLKVAEGPKPWYLTRISP